MKSEFEQYIVISGTNRKGSHTERIARKYLEMLEKKGIHPAFFSLEDFNPLQRDEAFKNVEKELLIPAQKIIFIIPEYNGSYPGVLKTLIDNSDIRKVWHYKKALLTGVASGRAGNLRGMDHLADTLQYLRMTVHYNKLPISKIDKMWEQYNNPDPDTLNAMELQLEEFIRF